MDHPGDEFWNDWVVGGFDGESEFDRYLPFQSQPTPEQRFVLAVGARDVGWRNACR
jgi:hypothetical protein